MLPQDCDRREAVVAKLWERALANDLMSSLVLENRRPGRSASVLWPSAFAPETPLSKSLGTARVDRRQSLGTIRTIGC